jgi:hypothetical protein
MRQTPARWEALSPVTAARRDHKGITDQAAAAALMIN